VNTVKKILNLIKEMGVTEKKFLDDLEFDKSTLSNWKNGRSKSYIAHADKIADYLGVTKDYLLTDDDAGERINDFNTAQKVFFNSLGKRYRAVLNDMHFKSNIPKERAKDFFVHEYLLFDDEVEIKPHLTREELDEIIKMYPKASEIEGYDKIITELNKAAARPLGDEYVKKSEFNSLFDKLNDKMDTIISLVQPHSKNESEINPEGQDAPKTGAMAAGQ
jgi:transcriptional regulator with XRE-family HTH domain